MTYEELRDAAGRAVVSRPFPSLNRSILTEIHLCHACSYHEIEDGNARTGGQQAAAGGRGERARADDDAPRLDPGWLVHRRLIGGRILAPPATARLTFTTTHPTPTIGGGPHRSWERERRGACPRRPPQLVRPSHGEVLHPRPTAAWD
eukprot:COSAG01_NODE_5367_length_4305_cov_60.283642_3_plen_148_part_00